MNISELANLLFSDVVIACLFPLSILAIGYYTVPSFSIFNLFKELILGSTPIPHSGGVFSPHRAAQAYASYASLARGEAKVLRSSYKKLNSYQHKRLAEAIGYPTKLARLDDAIAANARLAQAIAHRAHAEYGPASHKEELNSGDLGRVREAMKHFVRDWSRDGAEERKTIFTPILDTLGECRSEKRRAMSVLVPGSGLGRLAWEISELGYSTMANEMSGFMNHALRFLLDPGTTAEVDQHQVQPYAHWFSHQRTNDALFRSITFPDAVPRLSSRFSLYEGDFLSLKPALSHDGGEAGYDFIVTLFFIDTSVNIFATLEHIYSLLKPGGRWINLGPLLWMAGGQARAELSLEEVLDAVQRTGFIVRDGHRRTVECEYTTDKEAMMCFIYKAEFWIGEK